MADPTVEEVIAEFRRGEANTDPYDAIRVLIDEVGRLIEYSANLLEQIRRMEVPVLLTGCQVEITALSNHIELKTAARNYIAVEQRMTGDG